MDIRGLHSLKLTAKAPENGWLEYFLISLLGRGARPILGSKMLLVSGRVNLIFPGVPRGANVGRFTD